ncbi:hypothetical protein E3J79_04490 [Candidatus Dependentiae bacterium]|nr:MAG: hypothetical protein E3J79_04490 [Candidatus Dependentiae bacterium]
MMINLTLVVQAGNFLIAYLMIRTLLLRPVIVCIREDDAEYEQAVAKVAKQKEQVKAQEERINERWQAFQETFLEQIPDVARVREVEITILQGIPELPPIDEKNVHRLANEAAKQLIEKVAYVH